VAVGRRDYVAAGLLTACYLTPHTSHLTPHTSHPSPTPTPPPPHPTPTTHPTDRHPGCHAPQDGVGDPAAARPQRQADHPVQQGECQDAAVCFDTGWLWVGFLLRSRWVDDALTGLAGHHQPVPAAIELLLNLPSTAINQCKRVTPPWTRLRARGAAPSSACRALWMRCSPSSTSCPSSC